VTAGESQCSQAVKETYVRRQRGEEVGVELERDRSPFVHSALICIRHT